MKINNFSDFCSALLSCGFSMGGGSAKGIFALIPYGWEEQHLMGSPVKWHTGDPETDPWEWRMRVLEERCDIAYAKLFFRASGYITEEWYPYFLAVRRSGETLEEAYQNGTVSQAAMRIYRVIAESGRVPLHEIKAMGGFGREEQSGFERAMVELQTRMFITMCGRAQKVNQFNQAYGWNSTVFCTVASFWGDSMLERARSIPKQTATEKISERIKLLNPAAEDKKIKKFING
jgi:hypothetical protein